MESTSFCVPEWSQGKYWIVKDATGRICAQGSKELCDAVVRGELGAIVRPGDLFDDF